jgi:hypothetical protein
MRTANPPSHGVLHVRVADDLLLDGGAWNLAEDQKDQPVARITPPATPMSQQIVAYLEVKQVPPCESVRRADERFRQVSGGLTGQPSPTAITVIRTMEGFRQA